ncbi:hypothetical protein AB0K04_27870 [Micromonospora coxensis]|uniref:hypothetical protein n=1 Tax=Micromonospora coxensis TaxID=356852 RepID=UPI00342238D8
MSEPDPASFSDEEYAFLRHVRFGELPAPVRPDERVELRETDARRDYPEPVDDPDQRALGLLPGVG